MHSRKQTGFDSVFNTFFKFNEKKKKAYSNFVMFSFSLRVMCSVQVVVSWVGCWCFSFLVAVVNVVIVVVVVFSCSEIAVFSTSDYLVLLPFFKAFAKHFNTSKRLHLMLWCGGITFTYYKGFTCNYVQMNAGFLFLRANYLAWTSLFNLLHLVFSFSYFSLILCSSTRFQINSLDL